MLKKLAIPAIVTLAVMSGSINAPALAQQTGTKTQIDILEDRVSDLESAVFERIILVRNEPLDTVGNCMEFLSVLASITDNDADNRYLIWLEPGIYDCGNNTVQMKPFVDIQGSGRNVTAIRGNVDGPFLGVVTGADASELRSMRVEHTGTSVSAVNAVSTGDTSMRVVDVAAVAQNSTGGATGVFARGTSVLLNVSASGDNTDAPPEYSANGVFVLSGSPELVNVSATATGGPGVTDAWALQLFSSANVTVRNSSFVGPTAIRVSGAVNLASTQLDGLVTLFGSGIARCVGTYDGNFNPLDELCNAVP